MRFFFGKKIKKPIQKRVNALAAYELDDKIAMIQTIFHGTP